MNKYKAVKTTVDGIEFDSKKEAKRYQQLKLMERAGLICHLKRQVKRELIPAQYKNGKCVERAVTYTSDFEYRTLKPLKANTVMAEPDSLVMGEYVVEDCKGYRTEVYKLKKKLMLYRYGIVITEV